MSTESKLWQLPKVTTVNARRVHYDQPRVYYSGTDRREARDAVEIMVSTAGEFPVRALSPALFVGETPILEYEQTRQNLYCFRAFEYQSLQEGAPISLGWPLFPDQKVNSGFSYHAQNGPIA